jgi:hypothetical protein
MSRDSYFLLIRELFLDQRTNVPNTAYRTTHLGDRLGIYGLRAINITIENWAETAIEKMLGTSFSFGKRVYVRSALAQTPSEEGAALTLYPRLKTLA